MSDTKHIREKSTELLQHALNNNEALAKDIERAIYNIHSNHMNTDYKNAIRSHVLNLKDTSNPLLKENVLQRVIDPVEFAHMDANAMASLDRRQTNEILRRSSLLDSLDTEQVQPMKRDLDDPDRYNR
ncbi:transcription factor S-II, central domain-containing protein [Halteromyces radiatus]|uniref:transcription factor S-II, central domain-containing protein n=1 Tax=Halteromyces radiatus TaxID=101107 RepID=UPI00221F9604|nr:transcription factor S-II, central domain-containing protein [Halteromyces radiatus]KAI8097152.1 transcription factor S-II, central domain-containing protein [Halteromyces radiatus]